jgi:hypothetical protein
MYFATQAVWSACTGIGCHFGPCIPHTSVKIMLCAVPPHASLATRHICPQEASFIYNSQCYLQIAALFLCLAKSPACLLCDAVWMSCYVYLLVGLFEELFRFSPSPKCHPIHCF